MLKEHSRQVYYEYYIHKSVLNEGPDAWNSVCLAN